MAAHLGQVAYRVVQRRLTRGQRLDESARSAVQRLRVARPQLQRGRASRDAQLVVSIDGRAEVRPASASAAEVARREVVVAREQHVLDRRARIALAALVHELDRLVADPLLLPICAAWRGARARSGGWVMGRERAAGDGQGSTPMERARAPPRERAGDAPQRGAPGSSCLAQRKEPSACSYCSMASAYDCAPGARARHTHTRGRAVREAAGQGSLGLAGPKARVKTATARVCSATRHSTPLTPQRMPSWSWVGHWRLHRNAGTPQARTPRSRGRLRTRAPQATPLPPACTPWP
eukprot:3290426-Prymnesium_polylepis.2